MRLLTAFLIVSITAQAISVLINNIASPGITFEIIENVKVADQFAKTQCILNLNIIDDFSVYLSKINSNLNTTLLSDEINEINKRLISKSTNNLKLNVTNETIVSQEIEHLYQIINNEESSVIDVIGYGKLVQAWQGVKNVMNNVIENNETGKILCKEAIIKTARENNINLNSEFESNIFDVIFVKLSFNNNFAIIDIDVPIISESTYQKTAVIQIPNVIVEKHSIIDIDDTEKTIIAQTNKKQIFYQNDIYKQYDWKIGPVYFMKRSKKHNYCIENMFLYNNKQNCTSSNIRGNNFLTITKKSIYFSVQEPLDIYVTRNNIVKKIRIKKDSELSDIDQCIVFGKNFYIQFDSGKTIQGIIMLNSNSDLDQTALILADIEQDVVFKSWSKMIMLCLIIITFVVFAIAKSTASA